MAADSPRKKIELQVLLGFGILCFLFLVPVLFSWYLPPPAQAPGANATVHVKILAINDFHGQLPPGQKLNKRPAGGAPVLASYLKAEMAPGMADGTIIALPGDIIGASPPESGLLLDEPTLLFFNSWVNPDCTPGIHPETASCNMVATPGNHEFDKGIPELMRIISGGDGATNISHLVDPYPGSRIGYICANVVWTANNTPVFSPYTVRNVSGISIAFIGADTKNTPSLESPAAVAGVTFLDEADSINRYIPEIRNKGIHAIVVLLHEGGSQAPYTGATQPNGTVTGRVTEIIPRLDSDVDVVLSGHTHQFTNAYLENAGGKPVLVTQAYMYSTGFADVDLTIDRANGEVVVKSAQIIPAYADQAPGTTPDPAAAAFLAADEKLLGPMVNQFIGVAGEDITRTQDNAGEEALGDMVADGQRAAMKTDVGFDTAGDIRADIGQGNITWGDLYAVQPFADTIQSMTLSGDQIRRALEQQWQEPLPPKNLMVSGLVYSWDASKPVGSRVTSVKIHGVPLDRNASYSVSVTDYLTGGGDGYTTFTEGTNITNGPPGVDAFVAYIGSLPQPVNGTVDGRIQRIH